MPQNNKIFVDKQEELILNEINDVWEEFEKHT
jgi:hypothetical protein